MNEEEIKEQLKLSKKQNKETRYNYIAQTFNPINFVIKLEKYVIKTLKENQQLKEQLEKERKARKEAIELIKEKQRKDEFLELNEWQTRDLIKILDIDKGE